MKSKSLKLLIISIPIIAVGFFINTFVLGNTENKITYMPKANADVPVIGDAGGSCQGGSCEGSQ